MISFKIGPCLIKIPAPYPPDPRRGILRERAAAHRGTDADVDGARGESRGVPRAYRGATQRAAGGVQGRDADPVPPRKTMRFWSEGIAGLFPNIQPVGKSKCMVSDSCQHPEISFASSHFGGRECGLGVSPRFLLPWLTGCSFKKKLLQPQR